jgi:hypothetical protein
MCVLCVEYVCAVCVLCVGSVYLERDASGSVGGGDLRDENREGDASGSDGEMEDEKVRSVSCVCVSLVLKEREYICACARVGIRW